MEERKIFFSNKLSSESVSFRIRETNPAGDPLGMNMESMMERMAWVVPILSIIRVISVKDNCLNTMTIMEVRKILLQPVFDRSTTIQHCLLLNGKTRHLLIDWSAAPSILLILLRRDIVGNNLHFKTTPRSNDWIEDENDQLAALLLYRDMLKRNLTTAARAGGGMPR